ncbi:MAG: phytanoyl-CoA dioxygenase family protein [Acidimicrobiales bacterium]
MNVDLRTRFDADVGQVDAAEFFAVDLPAAVERHPDLIERLVGLNLRPLRIEVDGRSWVLQRDAEGTPRVTGDGDTSLTLRLTADQLSDLVNDQITPVGLMTAGTLDLEPMRIGGLMDWWLVLRSLLDERPIHTSGGVDLPDDLGRSFTLDDDPEELRAYLARAGYLHLRGVYTPEEMQRISDDMDAAEPEYADGDGHSWWATLSDGSRRVVRMQRFEDRSPTTTALLDDDRLRALGRLPGCGHTVDVGREYRVEALFKPLGVRQGISDVPWHKDCSLGRHSYECCSLTIGISVTGAGPTSGQLRVVPGSHRALVWPSLFDAAQLDLPDLPLPTEAGDVTVHLSCTLHMAQPPTERERKVLYTGFRLPPRDADAAETGRRRLRAARDSAPLTTSQAPAG